MIEKAEAIEIVEALLNRDQDAESLAWAGPIEMNYGWIFFANTARYIATKDRKFSLIECGIIAFDSSDSSVTMLPFIDLHYFNLKHPAR